MSEVIIGMDPHKHSATIEIINRREQILDQGRFATTTTGYRAMRRRPQAPAATVGDRGRHRPVHRPASGRRR